jgi:hypothetical protein
MATKEMRGIPVEIMANARSIGAVYVQRSPLRLDLPGQEPMPQLMQRGWSGAWLRRDANDTKDASMSPGQHRCVIGVVAGSTRKAALRT